MRRADNVYDVIVKATDGFNSSKQALAVEVTNVNDNAPVLGSDINVTVGREYDRGDDGRGEGRGRGRADLFDCGRRWMRTCSRSTRRRACCPSRTGRTSRTPGTRGKNNVYDVVVGVSDGLNADTQAVKVAVTDVVADGFSPVITSDGGGATASVSVTENVKAVTDVDATDGDKDALSYTIAGGADATLFAIDGKTGVLTFVTAPDFENPTDAGKNNVYDVVVEVSDGKQPDSAGARGDGDECRGWQGAGDHVGGCVRRRREHDGGDEGDGDGRRQPVADLLDLGWSGRGAVPDGRDGGPEVQVGAGLRVRRECCRRATSTTSRLRSPTAGQTPLRRDGDGCR